MTNSLTRYLGIAPLVTFRILFGGLMAWGALRFMLSGWVERLYAEPRFFFKYFGFEWVPVPKVSGMYALYTVIFLSALGMALGWRYRLSSLLFFLSFTWAELTDLTNYLNHYYLVILLAFWMIFLPAHRAFSIDVRRRPGLRRTHVPAWCIYLLMFQLGVVYFYAGFAKLNPDWLLRAMPLAVWLPERAGLPVLGPIFEWSWTPHLFSWAGAAYDLSVPFFLLFRRSRAWAYLAVLVFHLFTLLLFNIGLFPFIMIISTLIFFPPEVHQRWLSGIGFQSGDKALYTFPAVGKKLLAVALPLYLLFQLLFPLRHYLYPGKVLWTEEGYRFSWRVMLVEKNGQATFTVKDAVSGRRSEVINRHYLTVFQEKQMAIQPDFMLQYARFLAKEFREKHGFREPQVTVNSYVALNGRPGQPFIDPGVDLMQVKDGWGRKKWIIPLSENEKP